MEPINAHMKKFADAHVFYSTYLRELKERSSSKAAGKEQEWRKWAVSATPNGKLLLNNSFFDILKNSSKIYLFHTTPNLEKITKSGAFYSSGGCLIGSIYSTPIIPDGSGQLRVHNLGKYVFKNEAPRASYLREKKTKPSFVIIEAELPPKVHDNIIGIDYIKLGDVHLAIYKDLAYLLSFRERASLQEIILNKVKQSLSYLNLAHNAYHEGAKVNEEDFFFSFLSAIDHLPILGYIYFEVVAEYLMLFGDDDGAKKAHDLGEIYNAGYKNLMFDLFPDMLRGVGLGFFKRTPRQLVQHIKKEKLISNFDEKKFIAYITERIIFLTQARLMNETDSRINWYALNWDFKVLESIASPLLGHLIHRELRNFGRFPDFYFYFDQLKALQAWNYWNHMGVVIPFNGIMPKGEIGINPAWPDLKYKVYVGKETNGPIAGEMYVEPGKEINAKIVARLVDHRVSIMRSQGKSDMREIFGTFRD